jgi:hypothetical protein
VTAPVTRDTPARDAAERKRQVQALARRPAPDHAGKFVGLVFSSEQAVVTGNDANGWFLVIPSDLNGFELTHAHAAVYTVSSSGAVNVMVRNVVQAVDMLSTAITIDANERTSYTAATPPVIHSTNDDVATGDVIVVDVDGAGTGTEGLVVILHFERPS